MNFYCFSNKERTRGGVTNTLLFRKRPVQEHCSVNSLFSYECLNILLIPAISLFCQITCELIVCFDLIRYSFVHSDRILVLIICVLAD